MKFIAIIPARYASTRFPGKPLADMGGKPMIRRVYEQVQGCVDRVFVATDDERIFAAVKAFGGEVVMTSTEHRSGTDRCYEAYTKVNQGEEVIINIQGDEPFIDVKQIEAIKECFNDINTDIATLVKPYKTTDTIESLINPNTPKVVKSSDNYAMYFSRSVIPYVRGFEKSEWLTKTQYYKHIGMYAYRANILEEITKLPQSTLEIAESLEQLRWLQNGYKIKVGETTIETIGIDTPDDLIEALKHIK